MFISEKLNGLGIVLPSISGPFGAYVPARRVGNLIYVSGQLPTQEGKLIAVGQVPSRCSIEDARTGARQCVINALAAIRGVERSIEHVTGVVRVGAFISSDAGFTDQPKVANGASEFLLDLFGDQGKHVRAAVGVNTLPLDAAVEIEFIFSMGH